MRSCVVLAAVVFATTSACKTRDSAPSPSPPAPEDRWEGEGTQATTGTQIAGAKCTQLPFAAQTTLPEASGAAWLDIDGALGLVVASDSGHDGAFVVLDPETGGERASGKLPLGKGATDDIEGLAARGDRLVGLTSGGYVRVWKWQAGAFVLFEGPYPIGSGADICDGNNCARDYEGFALVPADDPRAATPGACAGFACARADGSLYCVTEHGGKLQIDRARKVAVEAKNMALADCAFSDTGALYTGNNLFGMAIVRRIDGWSDPASAKVVELESLGIGFPEVIAVRGDIIYRFSDMGGSGPSLMAKFRCPAPTR